ncbi:PTS fructose transporter subunit IIABC [Corynebacterium sp. H78]|uniref:PTS fructose transporter subunit IIABC n=1 Tax=Corynebacterium sp. H78 TaxID=3133417 RepID=UPI0030949833
MTLDTNDLISPELIRLDVNVGSTTDHVLRFLTGLVKHAGRTSNSAGLLADAQSREATSSTGFKGGIAIPHCRSSHVESPTLVFVRLSSPVDFGGPDGPADLVFFIAAPAGADDAHLTILSSLARGLIKKDFRAALRGTESADDAINIIATKLSASPRTSNTALTTASQREAAVEPIQTREVTHIVAVTACPTGIAHTYMAADALTHAATKRDDVALSIETQGASGKVPLTDAALANADVAIIASDIEIHAPSRLDDIPTLSMSVRNALDQPDKVIADAVELAASRPVASSRVEYGSPRQTGTFETVHSQADDGPSTSTPRGSSGIGAHFLRRIKQAMLTGTSYMVPFVAASGLLIAVSFLFAGTQVSQFAEAVVQDSSLWDLPHPMSGNEYHFGNGQVFDINRPGLLVYLGGALSLIGGFGMQAIVPILSAYISYGLAHKPGIAPGFIGGAISLSMGAGFIGGMVTGMLAGLLTSWLASLKVPKALDSLMPMVVIPLLSSMVVGLSMYLVLGKPLSSVMSGLQSWLTGMSDSSAVLLGLVLGIMMSSDLGGPINKAAYIFATAGLSSGTESSQLIMAAVMAAGMVPPLVLALATSLTPQYFNATERDNGKAGWLLGASFISEGAIPIAAADPLRVIPGIVIGGGVAGAMSMGLGASTMAPHGGVFVLFATEHPLSWIVAILAGSLVGALCVVTLKKCWPQRISPTTG